MPLTLSGPGQRWGIPPQKREALPAVTQGQSVGRPHRQLLAYRSGLGGQSLEVELGEAA